MTEHAREAQSPLVRRRAVDDLPARVETLAAVHAADGYPAWWPDPLAGWVLPY